MIPLGVLAGSRHVPSGGGGTNGFLSAMAAAAGNSDPSPTMFSDVSLGPPAANRNIVAATHSRYNYPNAVTIGGVSATKAAEFTDGSAKTAIWYALVPTGTTGDVVASRPGNALYLTVGLWAAYGALAYEQSGASGDPQVPVTLTAPSNCFTVAALTSLYRTTHSFLSDDYQSEDGGAFAYGGFDEPAPGERTISDTYGNANSTNYALLVVDFTLT